MTGLEPLLSVTDDGMTTAPAHLANVAVVMQSVIEAVSGDPMVSNTHVIPLVVAESVRPVAAVASFAVNMLIPVTTSEPAMKLASPRSRRPPFGGGEVGETERASPAQPCRIHVVMFRRYGRRLRGLGQIFPKWNI